MGKVISKAGWLVFIAAGIGAMLRTGPDDPLMASFKSSSLYGPVVVTMSVVSAALLIWIVRMVMATAAMHRKLDELKRGKDR